MITCACERKTVGALESSKYQVSSSKFLGSTEDQRLAGDSERHKCGVCSKLQVRKFKVWEIGVGVGIGIEKNLATRTQNPETKQSQD